jgi:hypothetical protein
MTFVERNECPVCADSHFETVWRAPFNEGRLAAYLRNYYLQDPPAADYWLCRCRRCELIYQRLVGDEAFLATLYGDWITAVADPWNDLTYAADMADPYGSRDAHELTTIAAFLGKPITQLKVLDFGTGWGLWPTIAAKLGAEAYAIELAPHKARFVAKQGVRVIGENEIEAHHFDCINLEQVLEHVSDPLPLLRRLRSCSIVKVAVPNASAVTGKTVQNLREIIPVQPFEHINGFTPKALEMLAARAGLIEVRPSISHAYSWLRLGLPRSPKRIAKELVRPLVTFRSRTNLYRWFQADSQVGSTMRGS